MHEFQIKILNFCEGKNKSKTAEAKENLSADLKSSEF